MDGWMDGAAGPGGEGGGRSARSLVFLFKKKKKSRPPFLIPPPLSPLPPFVVAAGPDPRSGGERGKRRRAPGARPACGLPPPSLALSRFPRPIPGTAGGLPGGGRAAPHGGVCPLFPPPLAAAQADGLDRQGASAELREPGERSGRPRCGGQSCIFLLLFFF